MNKLPFVLLALAAVSSAGIFTLGWAPVEGDYDSLRVTAFGRVLAELSMEHTSVELTEDYIVNPDTCIGCRICVGTCPVGAISITEDNKAWIDPELCIQCGLCVASCPTGAIVTVDAGNVMLFGVKDQEEIPLDVEFEVF
jgi:NAD-dependent dihydropyrimidine dehydrogenase PreA subunit